MTTLSLSCTPTKSVRTEVLEFLQHPFGGRFIGPPVGLTVEDIASGINRPPSSVRRALNKMLAMGWVRRAWFRGSTTRTTAWDTRGGKFE